MGMMQMDVGKLSVGMTPREIRGDEQREGAEHALADAFRRDAKAGHADPGFSFVGGELLHPAIHAEAEEQNELGFGNGSGELRTGFHRMRVTARRRVTDDVEIRPGQRACEVVERKEAGDDLWVP